MTTVTSIPTIARASVRAFIKSRPEWFPWIVSKGKKSNEALNADLLDFALAHNLMPQVAALIDAAEKALPADALSDCYETETETASVPAVTVSMSGLAESFAASTVLAGVDQFISPLVKAELEKALAPVIAAANKPAIVQTVEKTITVEAAPIAPAGSLPYASKTGKTVPFNKLFGTATKSGFGSREISLWEAHGQAPAIDPYFVVDADVMGALATAGEHETNVWFVGPAGSGKSTLPEQFCAYTGRPFVKISFSRQTEVGELVGSNGFKGGETTFDEGALIAAVQRPGTVILLDELTLSPAGVQAIIQAISDDHRTYTVHATGKVVRCAKGVFFVVADNTNGAGDETGHYVGTNQSNAALVNRFPRMVRVDYLTKAQEVRALCNHTGINADASNHVVEFFHTARRLPQMEGVVLSMRQMVGLVNIVKDGFPVKKAIEMALLTRLPSTERAVLETLATLDWGRDFDAFMAGKGKPQPMGQASGSAAGKAFDDDVSASLNR